MSRPRLPAALDATHALNTRLVPITLAFYLLVGFPGTRAGWWFTDSTVVTTGAYIITAMFLLARSIHPTPRFVLAAISAVFMLATGRAVAFAVAIHGLDGAARLTGAMAWVLIFVAALDSAVTTTGSQILRASRKP